MRELRLSAAVLFFTTTSVLAQTAAVQPSLYENCTERLRQDEDLHQGRERALRVEIDLLRHALSVAHAQLAEAKRLGPPRAPH